MIKIKNIYWMLSYAFHNLNTKTFKKLETEEFENIYELFAEILIKGVNKQLKRNINREYKLKIEELSNLKGKILISDSIKSNTMIRHKMACEYDEFSVNSYMNQIVKITFIQLLKSEKLDKTYIIRIKRILACLNEVEVINYLLIDWKNIRYDRNNVTYKMIINVCYLVLNGLILTQEDGKKEFMTFVDDQKMAKLFENFVKEYYRKHFPELEAVSAHIDWNTNDDFILLPDMKTDVTLKYKDRVLIIDTKYYSKSLQKNKLFDTQRIRNNNMYQIFTYVKNFDKDKTGKVEGMILYAKTNETIAPNQVNNIGGNKFTITTLDLNDDFENIMNKLDSVAYGFTNGELKKTM